MAGKRRGPRVQAAVLGCQSPASTVAALRVDRYAPALEFAGFQRYLRRPPGDGVYRLRLTDRLDTNDARSVFGAFRWGMARRPVPARGKCEVVEASGQEGWS